ncbi:MAG: hypothetical protein NWR72_10015 [Bacteroidia bacterium]|nr:hypothetical protein [Bacteroidia bacterium]
MKPSRVILLPILLLSTFSSFAQNGWGLVPGSSHGGGREYAITIGYQPPLRDLVVPGTSRNILPVAIPVILGFSRTFSDAHVIGVELGARTHKFAQILDEQGAVLATVNSFTPLLRGSYRWLILGGDHAVEPYVGATLLANATFTNWPGDRFTSAGLATQVIAGVRIYTGSPIFLQLEVPYTWASLLLGRLPDGSQSVFSTVGDHDFESQFWPLASIGITW